MIKTLPNVFHSIVLFGIPYQQRVHRQHQQQLPQRLHRRHPQQVALVLITSTASTTSTTSTTTRETTSTTSSASSTSTSTTSASCTPVGHDTLLSLNGSAPAAWTLHINIAIQPCLHRQL
ncbi:unnamed protein product [Rotaria magnacalcarata]|uniref:Uncharacterized protein n=1 Tax=Rotaria magnacalcarata TaxID=392030 RepID=A0A816MRQ7_9BILA|nr:unnamed protein product [Rotaria magnacalcarata]